MAGANYPKQLALLNLRETHARHSHCAAKFSRSVLRLEFQL
jgi:hypothetical protein